MKLEMLSTTKQRESAARLAYDVYVEECGVLSQVADHERRMVDFDGHSGTTILGAFDGEELIGSISAFSGEDAAFPDFYVDALQIERFAAIVPLNRMAIVGRFLVRSEWRKRTLSARLMRAIWQYLESRGVQLIFADCQPHLLGLYRGLGMRSYGRLFNYGGTSVAIPLVGTSVDHDHLRSIGSPAIGWVSPSSEDRVVARELRRLVADIDPVTTHESDRFWKAIGGRLGALLAEAPDGADAIRQALEKTPLLQCHRGDRLLSADQNARPGFWVAHGEIVAQAAGNRVSYGAGTFCDGELMLLQKGTAFGRSVPADVLVRSDRAEVYCLRPDFADLLSDLVSTERVAG